MVVTETRDRILTGARKAIRAQGYDDASVEDFARAVGLTKGAVYSQFDHKQDVLLALIDLWLSESTEHLQKPHNQPFAAVGAFVLEEGRGRWREIIPEFWRQAVDDEVVRDRLARAYDQIEAVLAAVIRRRRYPEEAAASARIAIRLHDGLIAITALHKPAAKSLTRRDLAFLLSDTLALSRLTSVRPGKRVVII